MSANTYGRQVVVPLTNKSGGSVAAGDVVVVDTANNDAFTTTTTAGFTGGVGIAQETIANNAPGRVLISGYAPLVNVSASVTRGHFGATHTVAKQAASSGASRGAGTFCQFLTGGTTPDAIMYPVDLLGSSLTNPMTTAGDIIVGGASGTPARLAVGAAGSALSVINGAIAHNSGTSFPASKLTGDRYWRTDLGMEFYWDGANWVSVQLHQMMLTNQDAILAISASQSGWRAPAPVWAGSDIWLVSTHTWFYVVGGTALSGSHKWVGLLTTQPGGTTLDTVNVNSGATDTYRQSALVAIGAMLGATNFVLQLAWTKTGTPGSLYSQTAVSFRYVAT